MQISHAGRQSPRYATRQPVGPSDVQLDLMGNYARPRALREDEILALVQRFADVAVIARDTGFTGVQVHGAHGYLLSSFLSPVTNLRTDAWGGSLANRARFLVETVHAVRKAVGRDFPVSVKLNSDDFRKGGFSSADCLGVVELLNGEGLDLLEISGGNYEQPRLLGLSGRDDDAVQVRESTKVREAYFLDYAAAIRRVATMPMMVTGGFRTRAGMEAALATGDTDMIGLGRPVLHPSRRGPRACWRARSTNCRRSSAACTCGRAACCRRPAPGCCPRCSTCWAPRAGTTSRWTAWPTAARPTCPVACCARSRATGGTT